MTRPEALARFKAALEGVGYESACVKRQYKFVDPRAQTSPVRQVALAAFSDYPQSYQNACVGVVYNDNALPSLDLINAHRSLGAPLLMEARGDMVQPWAMRQDGGQKLGRQFALVDVERVFERNRKDWGVEALRPARRMVPSTTTQQPDFFDRGLVPALEREFQARLKEMLEHSFQAIKACYKEVHGREPKVPDLFAFLFRFVTAKIFMDRADAKGWDNLTDPLEILKAAEKHTGLLDKPESDFRRKRILATAWSTVSDSLHFQNLAVRDLAFVAESAFITDSTRKDLGVHSTPEGLAEYVVSQLAWDEVPWDQRVVFEPFCGHGIFLAKAMERMGQDLPDSYTPAKRHEYFRKRLVGVETEPLSLEICRQVLTLSDYPNGNSWDGLHCADVFRWPQWEETLKKASVVLANPPYEAFAEDERQLIGAVKTKAPAEMLRRLMLHPPALLGLVLPRSFVSDPVYREANRQIARHYANVQIVELPRIFRYADNETVAIIAGGKRAIGSKVHVHYSEVPKGAEESFFEDFKVSNARSADVDVPTFAGGPVFSLRLAPGSSVFSELKTSLKLGDVAEIHKGMNWIARTDGKPQSAPRQDVACNRDAKPRKGYRLGAEKMGGNLSQFQLATLRLLSLKEEDQWHRDKAWRLPWEKRKVVCNAARLPRKSPWRLATWADAQGLAFTKQFFAIWPEDGVSEFAIAAIIASPLANAFSFEHDLDRDNHISTLAKLPLPDRKHLSEDGELHRRAHELQTLLQPNDEFFSMATTIEPSAVVEAVLRLDAAVLTAYGLTASQQRRLLAPFSGWARPLPEPYDEAFKAQGYFPEHLKEEVTLAEFVSLQYDWDAVNDRRIELIDKELDDLLTEPSEQAELERLQYLADAKANMVMPFCYKGLEEMEKLLGIEGEDTMADDDFLVIEPEKEQHLTVS